MNSPSDANAAWTHDCTEQFAVNLTKLTVDVCPDCGAKRPSAASTHGLRQEMFRQWEPCGRKHPHLPHAWDQSQRGCPGIPERPPCPASIPPPGMVNPDVRFIVEERK